MGWVIFWLILCLGATWFDWHSTQKAIARGGKEANPVVRWIVSKIGWKFKLVFDFTLVIAVACLACTSIGWQFTVIALMLLTMIQSALGLNNGKVGK